MAWAVVAAQVKKSGREKDQTNLQPSSQPGWRCPAGKMAGGSMSLGLQDYLLAASLITYITLSVSFNLWIYICTIKREALISSYWWYVDGWLFLNSQKYYKLSPPQVLLFNLTAVFRRIFIAFGIVVVVIELISITVRG